MAERPAASGSLLPGGPREGEAQPALQPGTGLWVRLQVGGLVAFLRAAGIMILIFFQNIFKHIIV